MIITINRDNVSSYKDYFQEAFNYLKELEKELGPILKNEDIVLGTITSLDSYYSYIEYLKDNDHFFLGLSSPASAIKVNANSRTIDTTTVNLSNFTVVQKDNGAELLTFIIDRYFDAIDLFNADIYVQWTAPDADGRPTRNYASRTRKDLVVVDNKSMIKIGWIIDDSVTEFAGDLQFSLAFLINDPETDDFVRLNTLPASIRIEKALQPEINSGATIVCPYDKVRGAILNNRHYGQGEIVPLQPWFDAPGQNLPSEADLDPITNSLTLKAQALSDDLGVITYIWQHKPYEATRWFVCDPIVANRTFTISATEELNGIDYKYLTDDSKAKLTCLNPTAEKDKDKKYTLNTGLASDTLTSIEFGEIGWSYEKTTDLKKMPNETYWRIEKNTYDCHYAAGSDISDAFEDIVGYWAPASSSLSADVFTINDSNYIAKKNFSIKGDSLKETRVLKGNSISADEFARIKFYLITFDSTDTDELTETKENFADDFLDGNITKVGGEVKKLVPTVFGSEEKTIYRGGSISQTDYDAITHISTDVLGGFVAVTNELKERYFVRNNNVYVV
jgi:hypothetical protein